MRVGIGYDIHRLVPGRLLYLGGVNIPYSLGLEGHSDADVLIHAVCDALLGAAGEGDIGLHFPPGDPQYLNIRSTLLLQRVKQIISPRFNIVNIDCIIVAQEPKVAPYIKEMRQALADNLGMAEENINIKATTTEKLGDIGQGKAIAAYAVTCLTSGTQER